MFMPMGLGFFYDSTLILVLIGMALSMAASAYVNSTYRKYAKFSNKKGYTGTEVAQLILRAAEVEGVAVQKISGDLTDNYNSQNKVLSLSETVADSTSVAAIGVAAHECGHAVQDSRSYFPLKLRSAIVPVANIGTTMSMPLIIAGLFFGQTLINIGILCFAAAFLFQVVTLPVEFNASRRALSILRSNHFLDDEEMVMARKVLIAAALTYVAAAISTLLQLLRLIMLFGNRRD
ncbi:zinc metallopeptidase [Vagococcus sp. BWB3-3]|uniref:Zinc metallopeptidase n=1 Tax=Vagococcus allomyrinae TaxID=2794353 RepID=A0A940PCM1_9ENTE|nr:zinc metallopeptidase [Vagococcus allomyrinae]MBP1042092.1 zinc metallopeptidase [Vagococcus allomyrinae]